MSHDSSSSELEDVDEPTSKLRLLSLRQKMGIVVSTYLAACTLIFLCQLPALTESWNQFLADGNGSDVLVRVPLHRVPVYGEVLTYSIQKDLTIIAGGNESSRPGQSATYSVETSRVSDRTSTYLQRQVFEGQSFSQIFNLTMTNDLVTYRTSTGWANEAEIKYMTPLSLHLQNLHIVPLPEEQVGVGDSWEVVFENQVDEYGRHETITVRAEFFLENQVEVVTEVGEQLCFVVRGVWEGDGVSRNLTTGEEIGRTETEATTTHWIDALNRYVVRAEKVETTISYGWQAMLAGGIMGLEDYRSLDYMEARSHVSQDLDDRQLAESYGGGS